MSKEDALTSSMFHLWLKIHFRKNNLTEEIIMSNYCLSLHPILFKGEQRVDAVLKQKQPSEVFYKKTVLKNFTIFTEKSALEFLFNKVA